MHFSSFGFQSRLENSKRMNYSVNLIEILILLPIINWNSLLNQKTFNKIFEKKNSLKLKQSSFIFLKYFKSFFHLHQILHYTLSSKWNLQIFITNSSHISKKSEHIPLFYVYLFINYICFTIKLCNYEIHKNRNFRRNENEISIILK